MNTPQHPRLPLIVKVAVALTFFNSWVLFEETVIDRHGLWRFLPFYHVGLFCAWDVLALAVIIAAVAWAFLRIRQRNAGADRPSCFLARCWVCR